MGSAVRGEGARMFLTGKLEQFSFAYVCALAAQAGLNRSKFELDDDSIDVTFSSKGYPGKFRNPSIQLQLKCSSQQLISGSVIKFPLSVKNYEDLRGDNVLCPRYLAVLLVPSECADWLVHHPGHIALHNCCYWLSLRNMPATSNSTTVTVEIPLEQRLTTEKLLEMMRLASDGISL
jgi:hypothetical protein